MRTLEGIRAQKKLEINIHFSERFKLLYPEMWLDTHQTGLDSLKQMWEDRYGFLEEDKDD